MVVGDAGLGRVSRRVLLMRFQQLVQLFRLYAQFFVPRAGYAFLRQSCSDVQRCLWCWWLSQYEQGLSEDGKRFAQYELELEQLLVVGWAALSHSSHHRSQLLGSCFPLLVLRPLEVHGNVRNSPRVDDFPHRI
jgi:hypothetical protein